jgi:sodium/bile acid cotransporter 7
MSFPTDQVRLFQNKKFRARAFAALVFGLFILCRFGHGAFADEKKAGNTKNKEIVYRLYAGYKKKDFPRVSDMPPHRAMELLNRGVVVFIDTRTPAEMAVSMLPHAVSKDAFLKHPNRYRGRTLVAYCTVGYRSGIFADEMARRKTTILNLSGGILSWILEGGKVYDPAGKETKRIHVYDDRWDYVPAGFTSVRFGWFEKMFSAD